MSFVIQPMAARYQDNKASIYLSNSLGLSRSVKTECKEPKSATTTTTAKVLISDTKFLKI